jgi:diguanylate cyclase (GGDEF)-like protein
MSGDAPTDRVQTLVRGREAGIDLLEDLHAFLLERIPGLERTWLGVELAHPRLVGVSWTVRTQGTSEEDFVRREVTEDDGYLQSPIRLVKERQVPELQVDLQDEESERFPTLSKLQSEGCTAYFALPILRDGRRDDVISFTTRDPDGFCAEDLGLLRQMPPALSLSVAFASQRQLNWTRSSEHVAPGVLEASAGELSTSIRAERAYQIDDPADRRVLDELGVRFASMDGLATPVWVFDTSRLQMMWANKAALVLWKAPDVPSLWERDFVRTMSEAMGHSLRHHVAALSGGGATMEWTVLEPLGTPTRLCLVHHVTPLEDGGHALVTEALREPPAEQIIDLAANLALTIALFDPRGAMVSCNPAYAKLIGNMDLTLSDLLREEWNLAYFIQSLDRLSAHTVETRLKSFKGDRWFRVDLRKVPSDTGGERILASFFDVTEQKLERQELERLARVDWLTEVANRHGIMSAAKAWLEEGRLASLAVLDLDGLKMVNDVHGHAMGDRILQASAQRILNAAGESAEVGRMGGDEFLVLFQEEGEAGAEAIRAALAQPFDVDGVHLTLTASVGLVPELEGDLGIEDLIARADAAAMGAKRGGRNRVLQFGVEMLEVAERKRELNREIRGALEKQELRIVIQPIIDMATGETVRGEALLRWRSPALGDVSPGEFIPAAEEAGIMTDLGRFAAVEACAAVSAVHEETGSWFPIAINVSARELIDPHFGTHLQGLRKSHGIPNDVVVLEVTESSLIDRLDIAGKTLGALRADGFLIALDDFGTGYSSLSYLHRIAFDIIKIDRSLTNALPDKRAEAITRAVMALADGLGARVVGEGIETPDQRLALHELGCHWGQGYLFSRPLEVDAFRAHLSADSP